MQDEPALSFLNVNGGHTGGTAPVSLTRSKKDYQRSPGKIFGPNALTQGSSVGQLSSKQTANAIFSALTTPLQLQSHNRELSTQMSTKRASRPTMMADLNLTAKNKNATMLSNLSGLMPSN